MALARRFTQQIGYLDGHLLIASPTMPDPRFARAVVFMCAHTAEGAMGIILNQRAPNLSFVKLLQQLDIIGEDSDITLSPQVSGMQVHMGGPVEKSRGFVLHTSDYFANDSTLQVHGGLCLTATIDILRAIARGAGPERALMALGYAGWSAGQLEGEILANGWLTCDADPDLIFNPDVDNKYELAFAKMGFDPSFLASEAGHA
jgi:putative transcriptional regulator